MKNSTYLTIGRSFFAVAILAIGVIHLVTGNFPTGLLQVPVALPGRVFLVYVSGIALIIAGLLILAKYQYQGACLAAIIWLIFLLLLHLPVLIMGIKNANEWAATFENVMLLGGALILTGSSNQVKNTKLKLTTPVGIYLFAIALLVFAIQHYMYAKFIATLLLPWMPFKLFWAYFVGVAFLVSAISIAVKVWVRLSAAMLGLMFFIWVCILHAPLVIQHLKLPDAEPEWTSLFVALAVSGVAFLIAGSQGNKLKYG